MPDTIDRWIDLLQQQPLPMMPATGIEITRLIEHPATNNSDYERIISRDPGFTLALFNNFRRQLKPPREPVCTLPHAISLLGVAPLDGASRQLVSTASMTGAWQSGLRDLYSRAVHAASYARQWGERRDLWQPEEMAIAALLHHVARMALCCAAPDQLAQIRRLQSQQLSPAQAEQQVLGCTLDQIALQLAEGWHLPPLTAESLQPAGSIQVRSQGVMLAVALADASADDWYSEPTLELLELVAEYLHLPPADTASYCHRLSVETAHQLQQLPLQMTAARLLYPPPASEPNDLPAATSSSPGVVAAPPVAPVKPAPAKPKPPLQPAPQAVVKPPAPEQAATGTSPTPEQAPEKAAEAVPKPAPGTPPPAPPPAPETSRLPAGKPAEPPAKPADTGQQQRKAAPLQQLLTGAMQQLKRELGLQRVLFCMLARDKKSLRARFVIGTDSADPLRQFHCDQSSRHLFSVLLGKPQGFWLCSENSNKFLPMIPRNLHPIINCQAFYAASLFVNGKPMGLLYADSNDAARLTANGFSRFKELARQLCAEIEASQG